MFTKKKSTKHKLCTCAHSPVHDGEPSSPKCPSQRPHLNPRREKSVHEHNRGATDDHRPLLQLLSCHCRIVGSNGRICHTNWNTRRCSGYRGRRRRRCCYWLRCTREMRVPVCGNLHVRHKQKANLRADEGLQARIRVLKTNTNTHHGFGLE